MLSLLKKNPEKARANLAPAWHTNFRNYALLPDTKLVRTSFFVNAFYVLLFVGVVFAVGMQEYKIRGLQSEIEVWQGRIDARTRGSAEAVAQYRKFQTEEKKIQDLQTFVESQKVVLSEFLLLLGQALPPGIVLTGIEYKGVSSSIRGYVQGSSELASGLASEFEKQLRDDPNVRGVYPNVVLSTLSRDPQANRLLFEIVLKDVSEEKRKK